jgi:CHAP domain
MTATADEVLAIALSQEGYHETRINETKYGDAYGWNGVPWCAQYERWCFDKAGAVDLLPVKTASAPILLQAFRDAGQWGHDPRKGAIFGADMNGNGGIDHTGFVITRLADGRLKTVEGNTANQVAVRYRSPSLIRWYGYPAYATADDIALVVSLGIA